MKKRFVRLAAIVLSVLLLLSVVNVSAFAAPEEQVDATVTVGPADTDGAILTESDDYDYVSYSKDNASFVSATEDLAPIDGSAFVNQKDSNAVPQEEYEGEKNVLVWQSQQGTVDYTVDIPADGLYNITFRYTALPGPKKSERDISLGIAIDGNIPFYGADNLELPRMWVDKSEIREDDYGNQFAPEQTPYTGFSEKPLLDLSGASVFPLEFAFTAGTHTISITTNTEEWVISKIILTAPESNAPSYSDVKASYAANGYTAATGAPVVIEGEDAELKSTRSLIPYTDNTSPKVTPSKSTKSLINYIGNTNWKLPNEEITWVIDVPETGLYKLGIMYKQDQVINGSSYRHLRIDGETPFKECANIAFPYTISWKYREFSGDDGAYEFYLTAGQHTLSLTGTLGELADSYYDLKNIASKIGSLYLDIVMITGESPDANRDYELHKTIPNFLERLDQYHNEMQTLVANIKAVSGSKGSSLIAAINNTDRVLVNMYKNKLTAHKYVSDYYSQYTTLSSWLYSMQEMALSIDQMQLVPVDEKFNFKKVNFFDKLKFGTERFFISFSDSYSRISVAKDGTRTIRIWVNWGRDQAQVLNNLINESFSQYAIDVLGEPVSVNLELVNADLIKGMLSNNAPDLSLHMARSTPVNYALRGALTDLKQFPDYEEVMKERFGDSAGIPYEYNGGAYALPDQQSFYLMFYRTDIFEALGLEIPETWDEFRAVSAVLQRNNMNSAMPYTKISSAGTVDTGVGGLNMFCSILMQYGGSIYNDAKNECLLDTPISLSAFSYWTDMYTNYKIPVEASFYNRFRVGTMPLGIQSYTTYTTLAEAAPEITDRWGIALIPGIEKVDEVTGETYIDRTISGSGTGCGILEGCKDKEAAWTFLKWWTDADTQNRYNTNVESILGTISRITTANLDAFERMSWDRNDLEILLEQRSWIREVPEVPGSYYVSRSVDQAFWNVINNVSAPKDALSRWGIEANNEIKRKIAEYAK